jgi:hypothetical protein
MKPRRQEDVMSDQDSDLMDTADEKEYGEERQKLVPVSESIRYRKRAQAAEKEVERLSGELTEAKKAAEEVNRSLAQVQTERALAQKLSAAGAVDLETALLVAKAKVQGDSDDELDACVEKLKKEKGYLFSGSKVPGRMSRKTAGAKDNASEGRGMLEKTAERAATTGNRVDLQEYLKARRNFL